MEWLLDCDNIMKQEYTCTLCKKEKNASDSSPFLYPGKKSGDPRYYVCAECHLTKTDKIKTAASKKKFLPGARFGV